MFLNLFSRSNPNIKNLKSDEFEAALTNAENAELIDVRTMQEHCGGHIKNSKNIDIYQPDFLYEIKKLDKNKNYFVYCHSGARSYQACNLMEKQGFPNLHNLAGGMISWQGEVVS